LVGLPTHDPFILSEKRPDVTLIATLSFVRDVSKHVMTAVEAGSKFSLSPENLIVPRTVENLPEEEIREDIWKRPFKVAATTIGDSAAEAIRIEAIRIPQTAKDLILKSLGLAGGVIHEYYDGRPHAPSPYCSPRSRQA